MTNFSRLSSESPRRFNLWQNLLYTYPIRALHAGQNVSEMSVTGGICIRPSFFSRATSQVEYKKHGVVTQTNTKGLSRRDAVTVTLIFDFLDCSEKMTKYDILKTYPQISKTECLINKQRSAIKVINEINHDSPHMFVFFLEF